MVPVRDGVQPAAPRIDSHGNNMKPMGLLVLALSFWLVGCDAASDMKDMFNKQEMVQKVIAEKYGLQSEVGWNMHNGALTQVTVGFYANEVRDRKVAVLEAVAKEAVKAAFKSTPQVINVQVACKAIN